jgi:mono/diheme cytochrome c family protein
MLVSLALSLAMQSAPLVVEVRGLPAPRTAAPDVIAAGRMTYGARCQMCHGPDGNADTPIGRAMKPPPRRFSDATWQAKVTDAEITRAILEGGAAVKKSPAMPAFKDLAPPAQLTPLVAFIRSLGAPAATVTVMAGDAVVTMSAPVEADGVARVRFPGLQGPATVMGIVDEASLPYCTVEVAEAAGATVRCDRKP